MNTRMRATLLASVTAGCAPTLTPGAALDAHGDAFVGMKAEREQGTPSGTPAVDPVIEVLARQVAFDHGCPPQSVKVIRSAGRRTVDLDVCGVVRRYRDIGYRDDISFLDITALFPASSLPAPLQQP